MTTEYENRIEEEDDLSFGDIVWGQFKKNKVAYSSLWLLGILLLIAICTPLFASGRPFYWSENGVTSYPWLSSLFDRNYYENGVDIFFNLLLVLGLPLFGIFLLRVRQVKATGLRKRPRRKKLGREGSILLGLFFLVFVGILAKPYQQPYVQFHDTYLEYELASDVESVKEALATQKEDPKKLTDDQKDLITTVKRLSVEPDELKQEGELSAVFAPIPYAFRKTGFPALQKQSWKHWIGVDSAGRDVAVQMLYGIRISLSIGVIAVGIYVTIGIIIGALAGYFSGVVDMLVQRVIEIVMSVPVLIVLLVLIAFIEKPSIYHIMLIIGLFRWTGVARLVRGEFYRLRNLDFVTSAVALGYKPTRIIFQHILPNALGPVLVAATFGVAGAILTESGLSFLGFGDVSVPSWGQTLKDGYDSSTWHLILAPGFAIFATVSILNLVGEGLRDALDPKMRK